MLFNAEGLKIIFQIEPDGQIDLEHRAYTLEGSLKTAVIVAATNQISVLNADKAVVWSGSLSTSIQAICPHPSNLQFVWIGDNGIVTLQNIDGTKLKIIDDNSAQNSGSRDGHFDETGACFWLCSCAEGRCEIHLFETDTWTVIDKTTIKDPFGGSFCVLSDTGIPALLSLWLAAGQDGQQLFWLKRIGNEFTCTIEDKLVNSAPPVFSPSGRNMLVISDAGGISNFSFPEMQIIGELLESSDENNLFSDALAFVSETHAIVGKEEGQICVLNTTTMQVEEEFQIEQRCISDFSKIDDVIMFVYRRDSGRGLEGWKDSLLWWSIRHQPQIN